MALEPERGEQAGDQDGGGAQRSAAEVDPATTGWQAFARAAHRGPLALGAFPTMAALVALQIGLGLLAVELLTVLLQLVG